MKKKYLAPEIEVAKVRATNIICVSFGEETTPNMHAKEFDVFSDDLTDLSVGD